MKQIPDPNELNPLPGFPEVCYMKPELTRDSIQVGDFSYCSAAAFESRVTHHYPFYGDRLVMGKFCQIAKNVEFIMNGANHQMNAVSTFPFYILSGWEQEVPPLSVMPHKGDTIIGNDVWIGENSSIFPGVTIGDGAIIGARSVVASDVPPYTVVAGNPARALRKRFDDELIAALGRLRWWDLPIEDINRLIPLLSSPDLAAVRASLQGFEEGKPGWRPLQFHTSHCHVRPVREEELAAFGRYQNCEDYVRERGEGSRSPGEYRDRLLGTHSLRNGVHLAIVSRETSALLGDLYCRVEESGTHRVAFASAPESRESGYVCEAVQGLLALLAERGSLDVVVCGEEARPVQCLRELGFVFDAERNGWIGNRR